jgi:hypothetical protein
VCPYVGVELEKVEEEEEEEEEKVGGFSTACMGESRA